MPLRTIIGFCALLSGVTVCVGTAYFILSVFNLPGLWKTIFSLWMGIFLFAAVGFVIHQLGSNSHKRKGRDARERHLLEAMARIAQGDFSVFVQADDLAHAELADAINTMAKNLGNLETMRQDFISNVSHEIQSPLTSISGFAALLQEGKLSAEERRKYLGIIETESKRLSGLSDNLLKLSALDNKPPAKTEYRLDKQLANVILTLEPQWAGKKICAQANLEKCTINGDENLLLQVWVNLLGNAIKFTPENGTVCVSVKENVVKISDTGCGISDADLPHIFERFYKVDKSRDRSLGGNGLGLSLAKKIVLLHGGSIEVDSEVGRGTTFTVLLPATQ